MDASKGKAIIRVTLLSGLLGGLWGAFLEIFIEHTGDHLTPQLLNIIATAGVGLYAITKMQDKVKTLEDENKRYKDDNRRLKTEIKAIEAMRNASLPEWPEVSENHPPHDVKSA